MLRFIQVAIAFTEHLFCIRESSFNMTRGGGDEDIEGGLRKFLDTQKGALKKLEGAPKICILQNQQEGGRAPKKLNR